MKNNTITGPVGCQWRRHPLRLVLLVFAAASCLRAGVSDEDTASLAALKQFSIEELMQTRVTSVSKYSEKLLNAASAIQVISHADIVRSGFSSIPEVLRLANNLNIAQKNPHDWAISARGFNGNVGDKLLVLMDGRSVYTPLFSGVFWQAQDYVLDDLDRIEVISGPGGTLWGANAVNGVINITTKNARETQGTLVGVGFGTELERFTNVRMGGKLGSTAFFRVYGKYISHDNGILANGDEASDAWHQAQAGFRLDATVSPFDTVTLQGDYYSGILGIQSTGKAKIAGGNLLGHWLHKTDRDGEFSAKFYFDRTYLRDPFGASPFQPAGKLIDELDTYDLDLQHRFHAGDHQQIVWGAGWRVTNDHVKQQAPNLGFFPAKLTQNLYSFFAQDEIALSRTVSATVGSKFEHNDYTGWEVEPNLRLQWSASRRHSLWAALSRAVRTPSRFDRDLAEPSVPPVLIRGGKDFASESVIAAEIGYRAELNARASLTVSLFHNHYDQLRGLAPTPVTFLPLTYVNSVAGKTYGAEMVADYRVFPWWTLHAGYTRLEQNLWVKAGQSDFQNAHGETADPRNQWSLRSSMDLPHDFTLNAMWRWVGTLTSNSLGTIGTVPSYSELDVHIGWSPDPAWEFSLVGRNLLRAHHPEYGLPSGSREEIQRGVYAEAVWRF